jgi:hypothetical protein
LFAGRGEGRAACRALEEATASDAFEMAYALADCGLCDGQIVCRPTKASRADDRNEDGEITQVEISSHK